MRLAEASPVTGGLVFHILQGAPAERSRGGRKRGNGPGTGDPRRRPAVAAADRSRARPACRCAGGFDPRAGRQCLRRRALAFMAPRTLEPVAVSQLTIWGLRGLTALDPDLVAELRDGKLRLGRAGPRPARQIRRRPTATSTAGPRRRRELAAAAVAASAAGPPRRHAGHRAELLRRDVQPSRPLFPLRAAASRPARIASAASGQAGAGLRLVAAGRGHRGRGGDRGRPGAHRRHPAGRCDPGGRRPVDAGQGCAPPSTSWIDGPEGTRVDDRAGAAATAALRTRRA